MHIHILDFKTSSGVKSFCIRMWEYECGNGELCLKARKEEVVVFFVDLILISPLSLFTLYPLSVISLT